MLLSATELRELLDHNSRFSGMAATDGLALFCAGCAFIDAGAFGNLTIGVGFGKSDQRKTVGNCVSLKPN